MRTQPARQGGTVPTWLLSSPAPRAPTVQPTRWRRSPVRPATTASHLPRLPSVRPARTARRTRLHLARAQLAAAPPQRRWCRASPAASARKLHRGRAVSRWLLLPGLVERPRAVPAGLLQPVREHGRAERLPDLPARELLCPQQFCSCSLPRRHLPAAVKRVGRSGVLALLDRRLLPRQRLAADAVPSWVVQRRHKRHVLGCVPRLPYRRLLPA